MEQEAPKPANSVRAIFTRSRSNDGIVVPLKDIPGDNWIRVRGVDADAVQDAVLSFYRNKAKAKDEDTKGRGPFEDLTVIASMISGWSFAEELTAELLQEALVEVPSMRTAAVNASLERTSFLPPNAPPSSSTPEPTSP